jgi:cardiolipin synthase A/B
MNLPSLPVPDPSTQKISGDPSPETPALSLPVLNPSTNGAAGDLIGGTQTPTPVVAPVSSPPPSTPPLTPPVAPSPSVLPSPPLASSPRITLFVEPDDGPHPVIDAIHNAQQSVWLEMYLLQYQKVIDGLLAAHRRSCDVRVLLEPNPQGQSQNIPPAQLLTQLQAAGITAQTSNPHFRPYTHAKVMLIDGALPEKATAYIMSANFTGDALGDSTWRPLNRDYGILTTDPLIVQDVMAIFTADADLSRDPLASPPLLTAPNLVVSPDNAYARLTNLVQSAKVSLCIEMEMFSNWAFARLLNHVAAQVPVRVILHSGYQPPSVLDQSLVKVGYASQLTMHAKIILVDGQQAFVGSQNLTTEALGAGNNPGKRNRELGIIVNDAGVLQRLINTFESDWQACQS